MKTTIDLPDSLLQAARELAAHEGTTLESLVAAGLRRELEERAEWQPFTLRDASFRGQGLQSGADDAPWSDLLDLSYQGRGG
jgi:hypothetical protein